MVEMGIALGISRVSLDSFLGCIPVLVTFGTLTKPSLYLMVYATSLEGQTTNNLTVYATSAFGAHSLVSTVTVVQSVVLCRSTSHS